MRVEALASESVLARFQRLVEEPQRDKAPLQRLADRVSRVFVPAVLLLALGTFAVWWFAGAPRHGGAECPISAARRLPVRDGAGRADGDDGRLLESLGARDLRP